MGDRLAVLVASATPAQVREARGWIADCEWGDLTQGQIRRLSKAEVVAGVQRRYRGGWAEFVRLGS